MESVRFQTFSLLVKPYDMNEDSEVFNLRSWMLNWAEENN